jgi:tRNA A-37 threonylcarbamoyl transferase component Bud32
MNADRARIAELAEAARRLPTAERRAFLDGFRLDPETRRAVDNALASDPTRAWTPSTIEPAADESAHAGATIAMAKEDRDAQNVGGDGVAEARPMDAARAIDPYVGKELGGVKIERVVGSGGMGRVYLGTDVTSGTRVALKVLLRTLRDEDVRKRFDREGRMMEKLRHPGIATVFRTGIEQDADVDIPYIVMEYVEGVQTISDHVFRERLGTRETVDAFLQACDAVAFAHREGYVHRDIKPPNILVDRHGRVKVIDFGVARAIAVDNAAATIRTETGQLVGTMQYMSPEQFIADPRGIDARTDVYALCAVLYELLTGVQPHDLRGLPVHEAARLVCETQPADVRECNPRLDDQLAAIVMDGLSREKSRRPDDARALALRLRGWMVNGSRISAAAPVATDSTRSGHVGLQPEAERPRIAVGAGGVVRVGGSEIKTAPSARAPRRGAWVGGFLLVCAVGLALAMSFGLIDVRALVTRARSWIGMVSDMASGNGTATPGSAGNPGDVAGPVASASSASAPAPNVRMSQFQVISAPLGASVTVDGTARGRTPAVILIPATAAPHTVEVTLEGWQTARTSWAGTDTPIVAINMEPIAAVESLPRLFTLDVGALPRGATLRMSVPDDQQFTGGTWYVALPFVKSAGAWQAKDIVLTASDAAGNPLLIEHGTRQSTGEARLTVMPDDAKTRIRIRVH